MVKRFLEQFAPLIRAKKLREDVGIFGTETFTTLPELSGKGLNLEGRGIADRMQGVQRHMG